MNEFLNCEYSLQICLAVVDRSTVYYLHRSHCKEVRTNKNPLEKSSQTSQSSQSIDQNEGPVRTANISLVPDSNSVTVKWNVTVVQESDESKTSRDEIYTLIRRISLRPFGTDNVTRLFVLEDFNLTSLLHKSPPSPRYYTLNHLSPSTSYVICFETLPDPAEEGEDEQRAEARRGRKSEEKESRNSCWETSTLDEEAGFPVAEVATAAAVSTSTTAFVVAIVCCCCFPGLCKKKKKKGEKKERSDEEVKEAAKKDENDNESQIDGQPKLRAHLSRRHHRDDGSRCSTSPGYI